MAIRNDLEQTRPIVLTVPGLYNSGPEHWQTRSEKERDDCVRVELGQWEKPHRNTWVNKLNLAIHKAGRPVYLVAHSLGCHAVAWWAHYERPGPDSLVRGALLVAPPEVDGLDRSDPLAAFAPTPEVELPFDTILIASRNDYYISQKRARRLASTWGAQFADAGRVGHINSDSKIGSWGFGQFLLEQLIRRTTDARAWERARSACPRPTSVESQIGV
jgi:predicted alpha/beta hydrolase family esterase